MVDEFFVRARSAAEARYLTTSAEARYLRCTPERKLERAAHPAADASSEADAPAFDASYGARFQPRMQRATSATMRAPSTGFFDRARRMR